jgi:hypothetical protein
MRAMLRSIVSAAGGSSAWRSAPAAEQALQIVLRIDYGLNISFLWNSR